LNFCAGTGARTVARPRADPVESWHLILALSSGR